MELYFLKPTNLWGDYGNILVSGFLQREKPDDPAQLERAGPFLPPISFPNDAIIVSESFKIKAAESFAGKFLFRPAVYKKVVPIDWHLWDRAAELPKVRPHEGEPENYLLEGKHSAKTAREMEPAWEMILPEIPCVFDGSFMDPANPHRVPPDKTIFADRPEYPCLFKSTFGGWNVLVDGVLKDWLQREVSEWVRFKPLAVVNDPQACERLTRHQEYMESIGEHLSAEEYLERARALCKQHGYTVPAGLNRSGHSVSRYCIVCTDETPPKLSAKSYGDYFFLEDYIAHRQRVSSGSCDVLSRILIYDLETGKQMRRLGPGKYSPLE